MSDFIGHAIAIHIVLYKHTYTHTEELIQIKFNVNVVFPSNITSVVIKVFHSKNNKYKTSIKKQKPSLFLYFGPRGMVRGGRWEGVQVGEHMYIRGRFMLMYGKTSTIL